MLFRNQTIPPLGGILDCGFIKDGAGVPGTSRVLDSFALVYLVHGAGTYRDDRQEVNLKPGDVITILPGVRHWYGPTPKSSFDTLHVVFAGTVFDAWRDAGLLSANRPITHLEPVGYWLESMENALGAGNHGSDRAGVEEVLNLQRFLSVVALANSPGGVEDSWADRARTLLASHHTEREVADTLGVSHETFRKKFTRVAGLSPNRYRTNLVMDEACRVLATEDITLRELAVRLNFADEFHLSRRFKEVVGVPPSDFRARYR